MRLFIPILCVLLPAVRHVRGSSGDDYETSGDTTTSTTTSTTTTTTTDGTTDGTTSGGTTSGSTSGGTTSATTGMTTSGEPETFDPSKPTVYQQCMSLYFPVLWMLQTLFSNIFDFCPVFQDKLCEPFSNVGADCWQFYCSTECTGDGTPNLDGLDDDPDAAEAAANTEGEGTCWDGDKVNTEADPFTFGCFDSCFVIHATDDQINQIFANMGRLLDAGALQDMFKQVAQDAVVEAMVAGPNEDGTGGFPGGQAGLITATNDAAAFNCGDATCNAGNIDEAAAATVTVLEPTVQATGVNCDDGNNGGCSHNCAGSGLNGVCSCPNDCWELDANGFDCKIPSDKVQLICQSDRMIATLAKCVVLDDEFETDDDTKFNLGYDDRCNEFTNEAGDTSNPTIQNNPVCALSSNITDTTNQGCVSFEVRLDECSTQVLSDYDNNVLSFSQTLMSELSSWKQKDIGMGADISKAARVTVDFTCEYKTDYNTDEANALVKPDTVNNALQNQGQFVFKLNTVVESDSAPSTNPWIMHDSQASPYMVGETLYFEICAENTLSNIYFSVPDCTVKNFDESESYKIMNNYNLDEFVNTRRIGRRFGNIFEKWETTGAGIALPDGSGTTEDISNQCLMYSYTVFEFVTNEDSDGDLRLTCDVHACNYDADEPEDILACLRSTGRRRRAVDGKELFWRVSTTIPVKHTLKV